MASTPIPLVDVAAPVPTRRPVQRGSTFSLGGGRCISSDSHPLGSLEDLRTHYFGCLRYDQRDSFWNDQQNWDRPNGAVRLADEAQPQIPWSRQEHSVEFVKYASALRVKGDLKRVEIVRSALAGSPTKLVENVATSGKAWRAMLVSSDKTNGSPPTNSEERQITAVEDYLEDLEESSMTAVERVIHRYKKKHEAKPRTPTQNLLNMAMQDNIYNLKRDVKAQAIFMQPLQQLQVKEELAKSGLKDALRGMMVPLQMQIHDEVYKGQFPDQHLSIEKLLSDEFIKLSEYYENDTAVWKAHSGLDSPAGKVQTDESSESDENADGPLPPDQNTIRYFHIASNNMVWVKGAMETYFGEEGAKMVLKDELWKGQEHGSFDDTIAHSRYLRCLCERFSTDPMRSFLDESQHNMVLFMPYLHWDTDRNRSRMADIIEEATEAFERRQREETWKEKQERTNHRPATGKWCTPCLPRVSHKDYMDYYPLTKAQKEEAVREVRMARKIEDILWYKVRQEWARRRKERIARDPTNASRFTQMELDLQLDMVGKHCRLKPKNALAKYLADAARLFEAMYSFKDQKVLEEYLFPHPSVDGHHLHPRRTLDQSYFWKLKSTRRRDRDQVVYRHTLAEFPHRLHDDKHRLRLLPVARPPALRSQNTNDGVNATPRKGGHENGGVKATSRNDGHDEGCTEKRQSTETWRWTGHTKYEDDHGCEQCTSDICKVARVVMVDQLWMWILDKNTILTCFPKRFGADVKDPSGVHYSIRRRLCDQTNPSNHVRSVFDLALIILDECFDTFFDRTRTPDKRPQANRQAIALRHLQDLMKNLHRSISCSFDGDMIPPTLLTLLDVGRESELQQEIRDIIDELDMMSNVAEQQEKMVKRFIKIAEDILSSGRSKGSKRREEQDSEQLASGKHAAERREEEAAQLRVFKKRAADLKSDMAMRLKELSGLKKSAESTAMNVDNLLNLKQQQAGVVQAYQAVMQGRTTVKQGKAIMVFTVLTIIFLPMSFFTSLFGMNNIELQGGPSNSTNSSGNGTSSDSSGASNSNTTTDSSYDPPGLTAALGVIPNFQATTFLSQFVLMLGISVALITFVLLVAFDNRIRRTCRLLWRFAVVLIKIAYHYIKLQLMANFEDSKDSKGTTTSILKPYQFRELEDPKLGARNGRLEKLKNTKDNIVMAQHDKVRRWNETRDQLIQAAQVAGKADGRKRQSLQAPTSVL
ncbi:hypothetical protein GQ53DRAFT_819781 [Thozetella sp. PMI_491]|nr:hypothetical protein GQ53DRAFT_819781 [Thozetella sp. PMI_491]